MDRDPTPEHLPPLEWTTELGDGEMFVRASAEGETGREDAGFSQLRLCRSSVYVKYTHVYPTYRRSGLAGILTDKVKEFLRTEGKVGLRSEQIGEDTAYARGMYERHGWQPISGHPAWQIFVPDSVRVKPDQGMIDAMIEEADPDYMKRYRDWKSTISPGE